MRIGSELMHPGMACINCHDTTGEGPDRPLTIGGTVYQTAHEPDDCNGIGSGVTVDITDATGRTVTVTPNSAGNFYYEGSLTAPYTAAVHYTGLTRTMTTPAASGDCNSCHTEAGTSAAPGRIMVP